jgi:hypothetical protein
MQHVSLKLLILIVAALSLTACQPEDKDAELKRRLEAQAKARPPRASMSFGYIHELEDLEPGGPVTMTTDAGAEIEIQEAYLVVSGIEAHLCEPEQASKGSSLEELFIGTAWAHVPSSATRLGTPFVEDLLAEGKARIVGEIAPPLGDYCRIYAVVSPADDDVRNLSALDTADIVGKSLLLRGRFRTGADAEWQTFSSSSDARDVVPLEAIDPSTGATPLRLEDPSQSKMILLDKTVTPALFAGLTPEQLAGSSEADATAAQTVLERLEKQLRIRKFKRP